ncbi:MAG: HNH endonuclease [Selenomonadaceae bacterium]|nr:HNH endonuclease [Selenomonadaceae bacterium]
MQMTDDVRRALQTLRDNAENDFERHRIDVLERDLTNPPKPEIIDQKHQSFLGISFRKRKGGHYFNPQISIYRLVWIYYRGELPPHAVIHHVDENKDNNDIENLRSMTVQAHMLLHGRKSKDDENIFVCQDCGVSFSSPANHALYCPECRKKRAQERKRNRERKREYKRIDEETKRLNAASRRIQTIQRGICTCPVCGRMFWQNPGKRKGMSDRKTCSVECEQILRERARQAHRVDRTRICEVCGKLFKYKKKPQKTCSVECGKILAGRTQSERRKN